MALVGRRILCKIAPPQGCIDVSGRDIGLFLCLGYGDGCVALGCCLSRVLRGRLDFSQQSVTHLRGSSEGVEAQWLPP